MKTIILLCGDLADLGHGLDLEELRSSLTTTSVAVETIPYLCDDFSQLRTMVSRHGAVRAVLGMCSGDYSTTELQAKAKKAGLDPLGLEVIPLGTWCAMVHSRPAATQKAKILLSAALARARAFRESETEQSKLRFIPRNQKVTRRSFFTLPPIEYSPLPLIMTERCITGAGCRLCIKACPLGALEERGGTIALNETRCESCGICLSVCPVRAIDFPGWSSVQFEAQLTAMAGSTMFSENMPGLLFICQKAMGKLEELARRGFEYSPGWLPVVTPCLGMVTPDWITQVLAGGFEAAALLSCGTACPFGQRAVIGSRVNFCRQLLGALDQPIDRVRLFDTTHDEILCQVLKEAVPRKESSILKCAPNALRLGNTEGTFQAIKAMAGSCGISPKVALEHPCSPFGVIKLRKEACTACLACIDTCPTGALVGEQRQNKAAISFDALACNGCGLCIEICPEIMGRALNLSRMTDMDALSRGRIVLYEYEMAVCENCGANIASHAMLRRIKTSLPKQETLIGALTCLCPACRLSIAPKSTPSSLP
ncbi:MAG: 4Fe-4S binding protein [Chloroflexi bacterium]|nr:4Fe-4S binding protein [Chloroflexota bacterium]